MSPEERTAMIRGMVDRLADKLKAEPDDVDGWLRLARARDVLGDHDAAREALQQAVTRQPRSEEHTSELQSLMRISYAVFCLKNKNKQTRTTKSTTIYRKETK